MSPGFSGFSNDGSECRDSLLLARSLQGCLPKTDRQGIPKHQKRRVFAVGQRVVSNDKLLLTSHGGQDTWDIFQY